MQGDSTSAATVPPPALRGIRAAASAPAKCILLGEHAVVFGEPCLSVALDLRTTVIAHRVGDAFMVNGYPMAKRHHAYLVQAVKQAWVEGAPVRFEVNSEIPSASGTGSSSALTVAAVAALRRLHSEWQAADIANLSFLAERQTQGAGSPNDTSAATAGGAILLAPERHNEAGLRHLWTIEHDDKVWEVHRAPIANLGLVVGHTGVKARTADQVRKVGRFVQKSAFGRDTVKTIGALVWDALDAIRADDLERLGTLMDRCHGQLHTMGVDHPRLQALIEAVRGANGTYGAKLTGAGGGGAMVVLTSDPEAAAAAIERAGGTALPVQASARGAAPEPELELHDDLVLDGQAAAEGLKAAAGDGASA